MVAKNERPNGLDYQNGWQTFFETVSALKPQICLFIGVEASNQLSTNLSEKYGFTLKSIGREPKIGSTYPRKAILLDTEGNEIKLLFIKHTGSYFSWQKWHDYLKSTIGDHITWLEENVSVSGQKKSRMILPIFLYNKIAVTFISMQRN